MSFASGQTNIYTHYNISHLSREQSNNLKMPLRFWDERTGEDTASFVDSNEYKWVGLDKAGVRKELLKTVKAKKLAYYGHIKRKQAS